MTRGKNWQAPVQAVILGENQSAFLTPGVAQGPDLPRACFPTVTLCHVDAVICYESLSMKTKREIRIRGTPQGILATPTLLAHSIQVLSWKET